MTSTARPAPAPPTASPTIVPATAYGPSRNLPPALLAWLDDAEAAAVHPALVAERLRREQGWDPVAAAQVAEEYRRRFDEHPLGYAALLFSTGFAALGTASAAHVALGGITGTVNRVSLASWLTLAVSALPFAVWSHLWAARVDRDDPVAVWSRSRRTLGRTLVWCAGVVGLGRLVLYVGQLMLVLTGAVETSAAGLAQGALHVLVTSSVALPIGLWAHGFVHRFDAEDPTAKRARTRPGR